MRHLHRRGSRRNLDRFKFDAESGGAGTGDDALDAQSFFQTVAQIDLDFLWFVLRTPEAEFEDWLRGIKPWLRGHLHLERHDQHLLTIVQLHSRDINNVSLLYNPLSWILFLERSHLM